MLNRRQSYTVVVENKGTGKVETITAGREPPRRTGPRPAFKAVAPRTSGFHMAPVSDTGAAPKMTPEGFMAAIRAKLAEYPGK